MTVVIGPIIPWSNQMSKHKPATAPKHTRRPKIAAKAQRAKHAIVRSPKNSSLRLVTEGSTELPAERHNDSSQEASPLQNPATAAQDDFKQTIPDNDSKSEFGFSSATANVRAYQAKLLEIAQANMQFGFEFVQRFATIRSPVEFLRVIEELTSKRIAMFRKYSKEMAELGIHR
jgi:Phasin protein